MAAGVVSEFFSGVRLLVSGLSLVLRRRRLFWLGVVPPLITSVLFTVALVVLITNLPTIATALTPFADGWSPNTAGVVRVLASAGILGGSVLIMVVAFTTLTLAIGSPVYDKIAEFVEAEIDPALSAPDEAVVSSLARALRQAVTLVAISAAGAVVLLLVGLIPAVGQVLGPVLSASFGGWMICLELVGSTFERHGLKRLRDRRAAMQRRRARTLGFGVPTFLLLAIPFAGAVVFPVATAGGTLLARDLLEPVSKRASARAAGTPPRRTGPPSRSGIRPPSGRGRHT